LDVCLPKVTAASSGAVRMFSQQILDLTENLNSDVEKNAGNSFVCD
jgi:hypothetical protein